MCAKRACDKKIGRFVLLCVATGQEIFIFAWIYTGGQSEKSRLDWGADVNGSWGAFHPENVDICSGHQDSMLSNGHFLNHPILLAFFKQEYNVAFNILECTTKIDWQATGSCFFLAKVSVGSFRKMNEKPCRQIWHMAIQNSVLGLIKCLFRVYGFGVLFIGDPLCRLLGVNSLVLKLALQLFFHGMLVLLLRGRGKPVRF